MSEKVADFIVRAVNRMTRVRDSVYLDTNAWSSLVKGTISPGPVKAWARERGYHFWMARFQLIELSRDTRLSTPLAEAYPVDSGASIYSIAEWAADAR